jgi:cell division protein FtsI/penicillin-binding protein 2
MSSELARQRRLQHLGWLMALGMLIVVARLFYLQIIRHDHYQALADDTHLAKFEIAAKRGEIYAFDGNEIVPLVLNQTRYRLFADPRFVRDPAATAEEISRITGGDKAAYQRVLERKTAYAVLEKRLGTETAGLISARKLAGIGLTKISIREYPEEELAAQTLGFVNDEGNGQYGIEQAYESALRGQPGQLSGAVDVRGVPIATAQSVRVPARDGQDMILTIDRNLQYAAEGALERSIKANRAKNGSVLVMDAMTGDIKAIASRPTFNPADFRSVSDIGIFGNPVVSTVYEPGSIVKVFTMAAGLRSGAVKPETTYRDTSNKRIGNTNIKNATIRPVATRSMREVIRLSLNNGAIFVLEQMGGGQISPEGKQALYDFFSTELLLDQPTDIGLTGEAAGSIAKPEGTSDVRYATMTFGQGLGLTMIRMGAAYSALVNGGTYNAPRLVHGLRAGDGSVQTTKREVVKTGVVTPEVSRQLIEMMRAVVDSGAGRRAQRDGYVIGGKTGTAQKFNLAEGRYYPDRIVSSFFGFTGNDKKRYIILVRVDEPEVNIIGASAATTVFAELSDWLIDYYGWRPVS